ncbi:hypothetical protein CYLTODRAFT_425163 [Cylindrobasidium torrendii FP15055 ss-10]|uniref:DUF6699 domain-containing protein n=1 Tax=Cylindrobasidium torrendii FP15055 ss-10 TaxID=1314674 RepID=A0A0D7B1J9_9AGAR|nr:hypothetical protein CYLTODRAFT_425163 [Cylindrobasidium torrendii FP15055 ss-10]
MPAIHIQSLNTLPRGYSFPATPDAHYLALPHQSPAAGQYGQMYQPLPKISYQLHPALSSSNGPQFVWDMTLPDENAHRDPRFPMNQLNQSATNPPVPLLIIEFPNMPRWQIHVRSSTMAYVTVGDVLKQIYVQLRTMVDAAEGQQLCQSGAADYRSVQRAFDARIAALPLKHQPFQHAHGIKRVDFLRSHTRFAGLVRSTKNPEAWVLTSL